MKSYVLSANKKDVTGSYDPSIILSISMIVKNEEKMLGTCLDCIKPLLDAVPSELVIVDTGSADKTVEIAKKYTDKIYHFDWVNDFSAARNFGLLKCRGMWFMFLDADDHFVDLSDLIEFFNNEKINKKYHSGSYITHNFTTPKFDDYHKLYAQRIARRTDSLRFKGSIHECFEGFYEPAYFSSSYANHYGYAFESDEALRKKSARNLELLEQELLKDPDELRIISHILPCILEMNDRKRELTDRLIKLADKNDDITSYGAYLNAFEVYQEDKQPAKAFEVINKLLKKAASDSIILAEAYARKIIFLEVFNQYENADETIKKYLEYYKMYRDGKLNGAAMGYFTANFLSEESHLEMKSKIALILAKQKKYEEAFAVLEDISWSELTPEAYLKIIDTIIELVRSDDFNAYENLVSVYEKNLETVDENKISCFEKALEKIYFNNQKLAQNFVSKGNFGRFMKICADEKNTGLEEFINSFEPLPEGYSGALLLAVKNKLDLTAALSKMHLELMTAHLSIMAQNSSDFAKLALNFKNDEFYFTSVKNLFFGNLLYEAAAKKAGGLYDFEKEEVYKNYAKYCSIYTANIYNPDLLNEEDIGVLPEAHRFGYYMGAAQKDLEAGNKAGYVGWLKKALISCNSMKDMIKFMLDEFVRML